MSQSNISVFRDFEPRPYQQPIFEAFTRGYKRILVIAPRRMGKDVIALNCMIKGALKRVGTYLYVLPTYESARGIIWDCIMSNGQRMLDFIDPKLIESKNEQQMRIKLINGSIIKLAGSDNFNNSLVGRSCAGIVFSEFAIQNPDGWKYAAPILAESDGWAIFISTVRGKNHLFDMYESALWQKDWYVLKLTYDDTKHISEENWQQLLKEHSEDFIRQEFYCDFNLGIEGTIYGKYIDKMKLNDQIGNVPFQSRYRVNTAWDIGNDCTFIILWQVVGQTINIINCLQDSNKNLEHYVGLLEDLARKEGYLYNKHFFPFDMNNRNYDGPRLTRLFKVQQMGLDNSIVVPKVSHEDGIEWVRSQLKNVYIDQNKCKDLIKALENYRFEFNSETRTYSRLPVHNWASHGASAMKYLCLGIPQAGKETTPEELKARYQNAMNRGREDNGIAGVFRDYR